MKKLLLLFFVTTLSNVNAQYDDDYDFKIKKDVDINAVVDITNSDAIYNQTGTRSLGYGWYVTTAIYMQWDIECNDSYSGAYQEARRQAGIQMSSALLGAYLGENREINKPIRIKGKCYAMHKRIYQKVDRYGNVILSRSEAISRIKELKELLSLDIITQSEYDKEFQRLKKFIVRQ
ncbi:MAG: hypothetical protein O2993_06930 [Bacteroidetes bacterium]|nr:hypothetical protein [Bacteroidota bacterium]